MNLSNTINGLFYILLSLLICASVATANQTGSNAIKITRGEAVDYYNAISECRRLYKDARTEDDFKFFQYCQQALWLDLYKHKLNSLCGNDCEFRNTRSLDTSGLPTATDEAPLKQEVAPLPSKIIPIKNGKNSNSFNWLFGK